MGHGAEQPRVPRLRGTGTRPVAVLGLTLLALIVGAGIAVGLSSSGGQRPRSRPAAKLAAVAPATPTRTTATTSTTTAATTAPALTPASPAVPSSAPVRHHSTRQLEIAATRRFAARGLPLYCGGTRRRMVALTFDDGPGIYTHYAIAKLRRAHLHATFFLVGRSILGWPGLAQREKPVAMFGDHTMTHPFLPALPRRQAFAQIAQAQRLIARTVHEPVVLFRPPYEGHTRAIDREVRRLRMVEVLWDVDSGDSLGANYRQIEQRVIAGLRPGAIVLMHENRGQTIRALGTIFAALRRRHLRAVTVPQLIAQDPPTPAQLSRGWGGCRAAVRSGNGG